MINPSKRNINIISFVISIIIFYILIKPIKCENLQQLKSNKKINCFFEDSYYNETNQDNVI